MGSTNFVGIQLILRQSCFMVDQQWVVGIPRYELVTLRQVLHSDEQVVLQLD